MGEKMKKIIKIALLLTVTLSFSVKTTMANTRVLDSIETSTSDAQDDGGSGA